MKQQLEDWYEYTNEDDLSIGLSYIAGHYKDDPEYVFTTLVRVNREGQLFVVDEDFYESTKPDDVIVTHFADFVDVAHPDEFIPETKLDTIVSKSILEDIDDWLYTARYNDQDCIRAKELFEEIQLILEGD